jgi:predicted ATPase/DNA-binding CsgD family transcriptional regulator
VRRLLSRGTTRLLTLTGPAGAGKTHLGLAAAAAAAGGYADGVRFVDLAPLRDPAQVVPAIARALDLPPDTGPQAVEGLARALRRRQLLLLLDNFEQVTGAAPDVARLLSACPDLALLVTSRAPLRLRWEQEYGVPPLETPDPERPQAPAVLRRNPAVRLFVERAEAVQPGFRLDRENAPAVAAICARLDGLPLALELAAARAYLQTPAETLQGLRQNPLDVLSGGPHDLPPRQRSLRHAIAWSYALLTPAERALFRRLAVFAGRCSPEGAVAVNTETSPGNDPLQAPLSSTPGGTIDSTFDGALSGLVRQGLLRRQEGAYRMLETIRAFARERLRACGEEAGACRRHAAFFLALAEQAAPRLHGPQQVLWLDRLEAEQDNLRAALEWAAGAGKAQPPGGPHLAAAGVAAGLGLRLAGALGWFWYVRGDRREGLAWLDTMLALEGAADEPHSSRRGARTRSDLAARARALCEAGFLARYLGQVPGARTRLEEALRLARVCDDRRMIAVAAGRLGVLALIAGDLDGAGIHLEESQARAHQAGDRWAEAVALAVDAGRARRQDDLPRAAALLRESLARFKTQGDAWGQAFALQGLAQLAEAGADYTSATHHWRERLALSRALRNLGATAHTLDYLGTLARLQGRFQEAAACLAESLVLRREQGDPQAIAWTLNALGDLSLARGDPRAARASYEESLNLRLAHDDLEGIAATLGGFAGLAAAGGRAEVALRLAGAAGACAGRSGVAPTPLEAETLRRWLAPARQRLSPAAQDAALRAGASLDLPAALALAREQPPGVATGPPDGLPSGPVGPLSRRECEVAALIAQGLTNAEIAQRLIITGGTAGSHVAHILGKLGLRSRAQIAAWAVRNLGPQLTP